MNFKTLGGSVPDLVEIKIRKEHVENIIIQHPKFMATFNEIKEHHLLATTSPEPKGLFLYGDTGVGKTSILREYTARYPQYIEDGIVKKPILYSKVPVGATPKSVASSILLGLGDPNYDRGTEINLTKRLTRFLYKDKCDVKMIIIDEFQHIIDRDTDKVLKKASDWVKSFAEDAGIAMIICGLPESSKIFERNEQLDRRFSLKHGMKKFEYETKEQQLEFRGFLNSIDEVLPFSLRSNLSKKYLSDKIYYATKGIPYYVKLLLIESTVLALKSGRDFIDEIDLDMAYERINISKRKFAINPFRIDNFDLWDEIHQEMMKVHRGNKKK